MKKQLGTSTIAAALLALLACVTARAQTTTWTGGTSTNWNTAGNWDNGVPGADYNVVVPNTTRKPTMPAGTYPATGRFGTFEVQSGVTVTCLGDTSVTNEASGGGIGGDGKIHGIGISIFATSATIAGILDANGKGFPSQQGPGGGASAGGAYGGRSATGHPTYGNLKQPTALGSGGNNVAGGGAIRVNVTGALALSGTIRADGIQSGTGPGSGGSVWLEATTFSGGGAVTAMGREANSSNARGAGGGRIAIVCDTWDFSGTISAAGGWGSTSIAGHGQAGSLWAPAMASQFTGDATVTTGYQYHFPNTTPRTLGTLTIRDNAWFEAHGGDLTVTNLVVTNGVFRYDRYAYNQFSGGSAMTNLAIIGDLTIRTPTGSGGQARGHVWLPAGTMTLGNLRIEPSATVYAMRDTAVSNVFSGGTEGSPHGIGLTLRCASADIYGTIHAESYGFGVQGGPGGGNQSGSHGGAGRQNRSTYGRMLAPTALGSGGYTGGGGGSVTILSDGDLHIDGLVTAAGPYSGTGAGSGGSVWLVAQRIRGEGTVNAKGGNSNQANDRAGGGGRVAIESHTDEFTGSINVAGGWQETATPSNYAQTGTLFRATGAAVNLELDGVDGVRLRTALANSANGRQLTRTIAQWGRVMAWTDTAKRVSDGSDSTNTAGYLLSGLAPNQRVAVYVNEVQDVGLTAADGNGELSIADVALSPTATVRVVIPDSGTLILIR